MKRMKTILAAAAVMCVAAAAVSGAATPRPRIEVAFVLDSTGSMADLIDGAKRKIWSMANSIISRTPTPEVRIGLVTYRDRGDEYVTRLSDLTADIDAVFATLQTFTAGGGGDDEESVNQALNEAVFRMSWTREAGVLKIIFLVGDYPPHMDYEAQDVRYPVTCKEAAKRGIIINTVQCGGVEETARVWREIARLSEGRYVALGQSGNMAAVSTPFDDEIARTSAALGDTLVAYGEKERQVEARGKVAKAASAPSSIAADRAAYNLASGGAAIQGEGDLVRDLEEKKVDLSSVSEDQLPP
jgi:Mg-chelatase subunit ChlD